MILLSPSKGQDFAPIDLPVSASEPAFAKEADRLSALLGQYNPADLAKLMALSPALAERTLAALHDVPTRPAKPALLAYSGEAFRAMDARRYGQDDLLFAQQEMRILSGLYGCLRPLDLIRPHRLEMATRLAVDQAPNLYAFWGGRITDLLNRDLRTRSNPVLVNLASEEYAKVVRKKELAAAWLEIQFKEEANGKLRSVAVFAKRARGLMADFVIRHRLARPEPLQAFTGLGYAFRPDLSTADRWLFTRPAA
jgi:cytoplasmic iron level regulating protein YaaA (DUF328/UPF0246 family)